MMKRKMKWKKSKGTIVLFAAAGILLAGSAVGSTQAALTYYSENYTAQMRIYDIGVTLVETSASGTKDISSRDYSGSGDQWKEKEGALLKDMLAETRNELVLGKKYKEELSVRNSGNLEEYVRIRIFRNWLKENGKKETALGPDLIVLGMTENGWLLDESESTEERLVFYWPKILEVGESTKPVIDSIQIDNKIGTKVVETAKKENGYTTITSTFAYDGVSFQLEAEVDAVQAHNAQDAIKSAWGVDVKVASDGNISLQ